MDVFIWSGENLWLLYLLQPDITAPGVSIIAAYSEAEGPTNQEYDKRRVLFNSVSGTSMSCPHVSGIVGLLKTLHPDWSPAAIKSAIMTTGEKKTLVLHPPLSLNFLIIQTTPVCPLPLFIYAFFIFSFSFCSCSER